jgi:hypothetical protein
MYKILILLFRTKHLHIEDLIILYNIRSSFAFSGKNKICAQQNILTKKIPICLHKPGHYIYNTNYSYLSYSQQFNFFFNSWASLFLGVSFKHLSRALQPSSFKAGSFAASEV